MYTKLPIRGCFQRLTAETEHSLGLAFPSSPTLPSGGFVNTIPFQISTFISSLFQISLQS